MTDRATSDDGRPLGAADEIEIDDDALELAAGGPIKPVNTTVPPAYG